MFTAFQNKINLKKHYMGNQYMRWELKALFPTMHLTHKSLGWILSIHLKAAEVEKHCFTLMGFQINENLVLRHNIRWILGFDKVSILLTSATALYILLFNVPQLLTFLLCCTLLTGSIDMWETQFYNISTLNEAKW